MITNRIDLIIIKPRRENVRRRETIRKSIWIKERQLKRWGFQI
jgi:hypothetical protein